MGRRSGRYNQARKAERKSMELLAPEVNLFCEGQNPAETKEAKGQDDADKNGDTCHWETYQMALFCRSDQDDQVLQQLDNSALTVDKYYTCFSLKIEIINTEFERRFQTKDILKIEKEEPEKKNLMEPEKELNRKVGLFVRMTGFLRKKSTSSKEEKKLKQNVRKGKKYNIFVKFTLNKRNDLISAHA
ncbi:unnamed protein product [Mytilus edulis]|uniref:Uncharacterized protein n=1 Tax=Mytilus edulis TaxID=6550 RepID=A0A8S3QCI0_MYTED|nr:unnamed protein product [Mytilus edulis]